MCTARNGDKISLISVFSHVIRYFKEQAISQINASSREDVFTNSIKWVITVPAIWKDDAKQLMREAASKVQPTN